MLTKLDLDKLKGDREVYFVACRASGQTSGVVEIDISALAIGPNLRFRLAEASILHSQPEAPPSSPEPAEPEPVEVAEEQIDLDAELKAELQRAVDESAGKNRLEQFAVEQGLARTLDNVVKIQVWLDKNVRSYWSAAGVDAAVLNLRNELTWTPKSAPAPPPPAASTEVLADWQLPLNATEQQMRSASVAALKDLIDRRRKGHPYIRPRSSFGSRF